MNSKGRFLFILIVVFLAGVIYSQSSPSQDYDIIIKNGRIFDGSLNPAFKSDIAIKDDVIVRVAKKIEGTANRSIEIGSVKASTFQYRNH